MEINIKEEDSRQDYFISDDGYINIRLKLTTDDKIERERVIASLMGRLKNSEGFELSKHVIVNQIYFHNQNPLTVLTDLKNQLLTDIESAFDSRIDQIRIDN